MAQTRSNDPAPNADFPRATRIPVVYATTATKIALLPTLSLLLFATGQSIGELTTAG